MIILIKWINDNSTKNELNPFYFLFFIFYNDSGNKISKRDLLYIILS